MGAASVFIALDHPELFDIVLGLGGYYDLVYVQHLLSRTLAGGFCPRDQILENLDHINDPDHPGVFCGPVPTEDPLEHEVDFNHFHFSDNGALLDRNFHWQVFEGMMMAFGNLLSYNPASPYLPVGMDPGWFALAEQSAGCGEPFVVELPYNLNAEYNPDGAFPLITFCDGEEPVGCSEEAPELCGRDHPDYRSLMGAYDPSYPEHDRAVNTLLAVDFNLNRVRDYGEPVVCNASERYQDWGNDGCPSEREDGRGGCLPEGSPLQPGDPNLDDFDKYENPTGTEGNWMYDPGEPFEDLGLDGVPAPPPYQPDHGEGNHVFDLSPNLSYAASRDPHRRVLSMPIEDLERLDFYLDAGIRDVLNSAVSTSNFVAALRTRGLVVRQYEDFVATERSLLPGASYFDYQHFLVETDFDPDVFGRNIYVRYGDPEASEEAILEGDGAHVGNAGQSVSRFLTAVVLTAWRFPDPSLGAPNQGLGEENTFNSSFFSQGLQARRGFTLSLPPGYHDPGRGQERFPATYFLHGHGMKPSDLLIPSRMLAHLTQQHGIARLILVFPDGRCCYRHQETGRRECACDPAGEGLMACLDPDCRGPHETCELRHIPARDLVQECHGGSFFLDLCSDRWGDSELAAASLRYEQSVLDLIEHVDASYRTRGPQVLPR